MLYIPDGLWQQMLHELSRHDPRVERVAYLDGARLGWPESTEDDGHRLVSAVASVATTVSIPDAELDPRWFNVSPDAMRAAAHHLREHRLTRLAQVHTHGDTWVGHSDADDHEAYSQRVGSLSIVLSCHGRLQHELDGAGVHVRDRTSWRQLSSREIAEAIRFVPTLVDLREMSCLDLAIDTPETLAGSSDQPHARRLARWWSKFRRT